MYQVGGCCDACWSELRPDRIPVRVALAYRRAVECSQCGDQTTSGIFIVVCVECKHYELAPHAEACYIGNGGELKWSTS